MNTYTANSLQLTITFKIRTRTIEIGTYHLEIGLNSLFFSVESSGLIN